MNAHSKEMIDIYDESRSLTGICVPRKEYKLGVNEYMLVVLALIHRSDGRFLITKRNSDKKWAAGAWEIPGGGAQAGESSHEAVCREVLEETGIDLKNTDGRIIYTYRNTDLSRGDNYFTDIWLFDTDFSNDEITLQSEESSDFRAASIDEIKELSVKEEFLHYTRICEALKKYQHTD